MKARFAPATATTTTGRELIEGAKVGVNALVKTPPGREQNAIRAALLTLIREGVLRVEIEASSASFVMKHRIKR